MKKVLLTVSAIAMGIGSAMAQCTPDPQYATESFGLWPDSIPFVTDNAAMAGMDYSSQIDIKTFVDTTISASGISATVYIDAFKIVSITGQPTGFNWAAAGPTWNENDQTWYNGGAGGPIANVTPVQGCMSITAAAAAVTAAAPATGFTDYALEVTVDARIAGSNPDLSFLGVSPGAWLSSVPAALGGGNIVIQDYVLRVHAANGVTEVLNPNRFDVAQNVPNPSVDETVISFTTPNATGVDFKVYNVLGAVVNSRSINAERGMNTIKLNTESFASGVYFYSVKNGEQTITKKFTVK